MTTSKNRNDMIIYEKRLFSDLHSFMEQTRSWNLDFRQLDRGSFKGMLVQYGVNNAQIGIGSFNRKFDQRGGAPAGLISFALLGQEGAPIIWRGVEIDHNTVMVYRPGDEIDCSSEPGFHVITHSIAEQSFLKHCHNLGFQDLGKIIYHKRIFPISFQKRQKLLETIAQTNSIAAKCRDESEKEMIKGMLELKIPHLFLRAISESVDVAVKSPITDRSHKALRVIEQSLKSDSTPPTKVQELLEATDISERSLQYLIMWKYGITPTTYLKRVRLNGIRKILQRATAEKTKVSDIANQSGFWHMGQFAKDYKQLFGELPSETLRKT